MRTKRKPVLRESVKLTMELERSQVRAVDAYASKKGLDRSKAIRALLSVGLEMAETWETDNRSYPRPAVGG